MKHLFIIQCYKYEPALNLGILLSKIPNFEVLYSVDTLSKEYNKLKNLKEKNFYLEYRSGYYTADQALVHTSRLYDLYTMNLSFDWYHIISESDLPFMALTKVDELLDGYDYYGFYDYKSGIPHGSTWYGLSRLVLNSLSKYLNSINQKAFYNYLYYLGKNLPGGFDEYIVGSLLKELYNIIPRLNCIHNELRLNIFPKGLGKEVDKEECNKYGKITSMTSPVTLEDCWMTEYAFYHNPNTLFGRKFEYKSEAYNKYYKLFEEWINQNF